MFSFSSDKMVTLGFLELKPEIAALVFAQFSTLAQTDSKPVSLLQCAINYVWSVPDSMFPLTSQTSGWTSTMRRIGLTESFQRRIMDPRFTASRLNSSVKELVVSMMADRYNYLLSLDKSEEMYQTLTTNANPRTAPAGHKLLYKAGPTHELEEFLYMRGGEQSDVKARALEAKGRGDFESSCYFTATRQAAVEYAAWKKQVTAIPVSILTIAVPNYLFENRIEIARETWKRYVWHCNRPGQLPADLQYITQYDWVVGFVCPSSKQVFERYTPQNELPTWKLENGERAIQYSTNVGGVIEYICGLSEDKFWLEEVEMPALGKWVRKDGGKGVCGHFKFSGSSGC